MESVARALGSDRPGRACGPGVARKGEKHLISLISGLPSRGLHPAVSFPKSADKHGGAVDEFALGDERWLEWRRYAAAEDDGGWTR
jgi:hypothetical protein